MMDSSLVGDTQSDGKCNVVATVDTVNCEQSAIQQTPPDICDRYTLLMEKGESSLTTYQSDGQKDDIDNAILSFQEALLNCPPRGDKEHYTLFSIASALENRYERYGVISDIHLAIDHYQKAVIIESSLPPDGPTALNNLANCLQTRYEEEGTRQDLEDAIKCHEKMLLLRPSGHSKRSMTLHNLANCIHTRYEQQGSISDLEVAIQLNKEALTLYSSGNPVKPMTLNNLAVCLQARYDQLGKIDDLEEAIQCHGEALLLRPPGHRSRSSTLINLANCLRFRYMQQGISEDLAEAILYHREALQLLPPGHPGRPNSMNNLSGCLRTRFEKEGDVNDLHEAIQWSREALQLRPLGHPNRFSALSNLANCLYSLIEHHGGIQELDEAIQLHREAIMLSPSGHPSRYISLTNLALCLHVRYGKQGDIKNLEDAIECHREATSLCPSGHPGRSLCLNNLANALGTRYKQQNEIQNLEEAIQCHRETLILRPPGHPDRWMSFNNLGISLEKLYRHQGTVHLSESIQCHREALSLCPPGHPDRSLPLNNLAICLDFRSERDNGYQHLEEAIGLNREALLLRPLGHPDRSESLVNLATCLRTRYEQHTKIPDLEEAIQCINEAIQLYPPDHPLLSLILSQLALTYADHDHILGNTQDFSALFEQAVNHPTASLHDRFQASLRWIKRQNGPSGLYAYQKCLDLADQYILIRPSITSRHELLSSVPHTLASDAAASAIEAGDTKKSVEFLEQGRTLLWSQMGRYRTSLDELWDFNPTVATEFTRLSQQLEMSATVSITSPVSQKSMEEEANKYRKVADDWIATVEKIRQLDGFSTFLQSPKFSTLQKASKDGPIIIINISSRHSDAIIVQSAGDPIPVALPDAGLDHITNLSSEFSDTIKTIRAGKGGKPERSKILGVLRALWDDVVQVVVAKLQEIQVPQGSHIWWCPTSTLAMLPIHAAGPHRKNKPNLDDIYICSYTPTLSALIRSSMVQVSTSGVGPSTGKLDVPRLLLVAQPDTEGQEGIPSVRAELDRVMEVVPSADLLLSENGTKSAVLSGLVTHPWVHFASHGSQNLQSPFNSCFHLHDKPLTLLDIIKARLPDSQFAFLSACHSAAGDRNRPDETIHLAAALQFCGFRSVIGTMYAMADADGPVVAEEVYRFLFRRVGTGNSDADGGVDYRNAAEALGVATKVLRSKGVPVERWINFVHIGA